jgi:NADH dehydrogenase/NADH:ubiquinone oxidoreductase subunit G
MTGKNVTLTIDGLSVTVPEGMTILEAARKVNVKIPTLCDHPDLCKRAVCRVCIVENGGRGKLLASCAHNAEEGMNIVTNNSRILGIRKMIIELILSSHPQDDCLACIRNTKCELQSLAEIYSIGKSPFQRILSGQNPKSLKEISCNTLVRDMDKCVKCGRCVEACQELQTVRAINTSHRSSNYGISTPYNRALSESLCVFCGQCAEVCPVGAIYEHDQSAEVWTFLNEKKYDMVIEIAPQITEAICTELGFPVGVITTGKIITGLKRMGLSGVYNSELFATMSANEETHELQERIKNSSRLPLISCCSQPCIRFVKEFYPDLADNLSEAKSPEQNFKVFSGGAKKIFVSVAPCIAKKYKTSDKENSHGEEIVLTVRELARLIRLSGIDPNAVQESAFDTIACGTETKTNEKSIEVNGLANARKVLDSIRMGKCEVNYIKIYSCPSGCKTGVSQK